jgi:hypothetical protein
MNLKTYEKINIKSIRKQIGAPTILRKSHAHKSKKDYDRKRLKEETSRLSKSI